MVMTFVSHFNYIKSASDMYKLLYTNTVIIVPKWYICGVDGADGRFLTVSCTEPRPRVIIQ